MRINKLALTIAFSSILSLGLAGAASADTASLGGTTGPGSNNQVSVSNENNSVVTNVNSVNITNVVDQTATTGNATVSGNTTAGDATTGDASVSNTTATLVNIGGPGTPGMGGGTPGMGGAGGTGGGTTGGTTGGATGTISSTPSKTSGKAGVILASVQQTLPQTGASVPVDVSALRALYHAPQTASTTPVSIKAADTISAQDVAILALLAVLIVAGVASYLNRRQRIGG